MCHDSAHPESISTPDLMEGVPLADAEELEETDNATSHLFLGVSPPSSQASSMEVNVSCTPDGLSDISSLGFESERGSLCEDVFGCDLLMDLNRKRYSQGDHVSEGTSGSRTESPKTTSDAQDETDAAGKSAHIKDDTRTEGKTRKPQRRQNSSGSDTLTVPGTSGAHGGEKRDSVDHEPVSPLQLDDDSVFSEDVITARRISLHSNDDKSSADAPEMDNDPKDSPANAVKKAWLEKSLSESDDIVNNNAANNVNVNKNEAADVVRTPLRKICEGRGDGVDAGIPSTSTPARVIRQASSTSMATIPEGGYVGQGRHRDGNYLGKE